MKSVLIIDDEVDLCMMIKQFLIKRNYSVQIAHTLRDGFNHLNMLVPDALILDNNLPDGMGWEVAADIQERYPDMKITLISAYRQAKDFNRGSNNSIKVLEKPVSMVEIEQYL